MAVKKPRPHIWISGPDEFKHSMYTPWLRSKAQAKFRKEEWNLTFDQFYDIWKNHWTRRGRSPSDLSMMRIDPKHPWASNNIIILPRNEQIIRSCQQTMEKRYAKRKV